MEMTLNYGSYYRPRNTITSQFHSYQASPLLDPTSALTYCVYKIQNLMFGYLDSPSASLGSRSGSQPCLVSFGILMNPILKTNAAAPSAKPK